MTREAVARVIQERILNGTYRPGEELPSHEVLRAELHPTLSMSTFSQGVRLLKELGFLEIRHRLGTRVTDRPPHLHRYALALPNPPDPDEPTSFFSVLEAVARHHTSQHPHEHISFYHGLVHSAGRAQTIAELHRELSWHRLRGIIFACTVYHWDYDHIFEGSIARMVSVGGWERYLPEMPKVGSPPSGDAFDFMEKALDQARQMGAREVAVIRRGEDDEDLLSSLERPTWQPWLHALRRRDLRTRPEWLLSIYKPLGWSIGRLLMAPTDRPDLIVITDDTLVAPVTAGIMSTPPPHPKIIALTNFPVLPPCPLPVLRLGYDVTARLEWALGVIQNDPPRASHEDFPITAQTEADWRKQGGKPL